MDRVSLSERARMKRHDGRGTRQDQEDLDKRKRAKEFNIIVDAFGGAGGNAIAVYILYYI